MEALPPTYMPGDAMLIENIVWELKTQGIFDTFRKECIADVDTKPAYQNLRQRVEGSVASFLRKQTWSADLNKNQVREQLRKNIYESGYLETGVERIVDQVVNPKMSTVFLPKVTDVVYKYLGLQKPEVKSEKEKEEELKTRREELLPKELEAVSPESCHVGEDSNLSLESMKIEDDESPPFEPLDEDNSIDSHMSGISGLQSHDSNASLKTLQIDEGDASGSNSYPPDRASTLIIDETNVDGSNIGSAPTSVSGVLSAEVADASETASSKYVPPSETMESESRDSNSSSKDLKKDSELKTNDSSLKTDDLNEKTKEDKDKKNEKRSSESKTSSRDKYRDKDHDSRSKDKDRDKDKDKERDKSRSDRDKDRHRSRHDRKSDRRDRDKNKERDKDKDRKDGKSSSSSSSSKSRSRHDSSSSSRKTSSSRTDRDRERDKEKDKDRDKKRDKQKDKDDHYSSKHKSGERRSTDRDSNDGSGLKSSSSSYCESNSSSQHSHKDKDSSNSNDSGSNTDNKGTKTTNNVEMAPPSMSVSAASWDALEAQLNSNVMGANAVGDYQEDNEEEKVVDKQGNSGGEDGQVCFFREASVERDMKFLEKATQCLNKLEKEIGDVANVRQKRRIVDDSPTPSPPTTKKARTANVVEGRVFVSGAQRFELPLSPAESDSEKSTNRGKAEEVMIVAATALVRRKAVQRYSSDDLYKPRPVFKRSTARRRGNGDNY